MEEEEEEEEDFFPRPTKHIPTPRNNAPQEDLRGQHMTGSGLPSLDDLPQPFGRLEVGGPPERTLAHTSGGERSAQRRSLSSRLSSEKDHPERDEEDLGFVRPSRFAGSRDALLRGHSQEDRDEDGPSGDLDSLEKYRPHNYEFSKPKSEDINDLVDFYASYRAPARGRPGAAGGGGGVHRQRSLDPDEAAPYNFADGEARKKFSDPGQQFHQQHKRFDGGLYQNGGGGGGRHQTATDENGFYDLDSIDPATRLILERARQTRARPVESFSPSFLRDGSPGREDDFRTLRPPPGRIHASASGR